MARMVIEVAWPRPDDVDDEQLEALGRGAPGYPVVIDNGALVYLRFVVDGTIYRAWEIAVAEAAAASLRAFGEDVEPAQATIAPDDPGLIPGQLDLAGSVDVAAMFDPPVTRQYVTHIRDRLPAPIGHPAGAPVWARAAVAPVVAEMNRRRGIRTGQAAR